MGAWSNVTVAFSQEVEPDMESGLQGCMLTCSSINTPPNLDRKRPRLQLYSAALLVFARFLNQISDEFWTMNLSATSNN
jgi:hypothetical protein